MISAGEFRNGVTFEQDGQVLQVVEFQHVKPGKGAAFVRTKTKNVITGAVTETSYNPTAKFPQAFIERKEVTYSYADGDLYHFMDNETYDDIPVNAADVPDNFKFCILFTALVKFSINVLLVNTSVLLRNFDTL